MASAGQRGWPKEAYTVGNAGVMLVGKSRKHKDMPAVLLGGRFYTGKKVYAYTDFGGGVDRKKGESPQEGALRELVEELFGKTEAEAKDCASKLCDLTASTLVGGRPFVHKRNYVIFIVPADEIIEALNLRGSDDEAAIDVLFAHATQNSELTSVALVSVDELLRAALSDGEAHPLALRQLDGDYSRSSEVVMLRHVMVGYSGSICTIRAALECFVSECAQPVDTLDQPSAGDGAGSLAEPLVVPRRCRWNRGRDAAPLERAPAGASRTGYDADELSSSDVAAHGTAHQRQGCRGAGHSMAAYVFDMETGDPDDILTLLFLGSHPSVELRAVTITPGAQEQVALVRWILQQLGLTSVRLGAQDWPANANKPATLSARFYNSFGRSKGGDPKCERADQVLSECCDGAVTLVTGAALHNLHDALKIDGFHLGRWVAQGGFAGEGVVPPEKQMDKFKGKLTCPTWNFGGNIPAAQAALASASIGRKICVSKNVCHAVVYDDRFHISLREALSREANASPGGRRAEAFRMMYSAMDDYLRHKPGGKALHDPLALATAFDESVCELAEVQLFCQKGHWGSRLQPGSGIWISISYDARKFEDALLI